MVDHKDQITNLVKLIELFHGIIIACKANDSLASVVHQVNTRVDYVMFEVPDICDYFMTRFQIFQIFYIMVDSGVLVALLCIVKDLLVHRNVLQADIFASIAVTLYPSQIEVSLHTFIYYGQEYYVCRRILKHIFA